jgi:hypothetical protein
MTEEHAAYGEPESPIQQVLKLREQFAAENPGWVQNAIGNKVRMENVPALDLLKDEVVMDLFQEGFGIFDSIRRWVDRVDTRIMGYRQLAAQEHGVVWRKDDGGFELISSDGRLKVEVNLGSIKKFKDSIHDARKMVEECITRWADGADANLQTFAARAFQTNEQGQFSKDKLMDLLTFTPQTPDEQWTRAMDLIRRSLEIVGKRRYTRLYWRLSQHDGWKPLPITTARDG